jgi:hypothetical protein
MENPSEPGTLNPEPEELVNILSRMFSPAASPVDADEMLTGYELLESVSHSCTTSKEWLFKKMEELGFSSVNIQGVLYWLVNYH